MTGQQPAPAELLSEPAEAMKLALRSQGWTAAAESPVKCRLTGGRIDGKARLVTDLFAYPGTASLITRLPHHVPAACRYEASLLCAALNAAGAGVVSVDPDGVPVLFSRFLLVNPVQFAATTIVDSIRGHRQHADIIVPAFIHIARGESAASVAAKLGLSEPLPFTQPFPIAVTLDLSVAPDASPELLAQQPPQTTQAEWTAIARVEALDLRLENNAAPCAGPLISHADGTLDCCACTNPAERIHVAGGSASCRPERRVAYGHLCSRCSPG